MIQVIKCKSCKEVFEATDINNTSCPECNEVYNLKRVG